VEGDQSQGAVFLREFTLIRRESLSEDFVSDLLNNHKIEDMWQILWAGSQSSTSRLAVEQTERETEATGGGAGFRDQVKQTGSRDAVTLAGLPGKSRIRRIEKLLEIEVLSVTKYGSTTQDLGE
ncbi:hypothetical protein JRQ81_013394, partial [Phrynocephalus forsythii]